MPCWFVDFGLGASYTTGDLLRKLAVMGLQEKDWVVIRDGIQERGVGELVDAIGYVRCRSEVEACGYHKTPGWFSKANRWTVWWDGSKTFNFTAMRKGQDMLVAQPSKLQAFIEEWGRDDRVDKGYECLNGDTVDPSILMPGQIRVYEKEK